jgi:hypothetical protein
MGLLAAGKQQTQRALSIALRSFKSSQGNSILYSHLVKNHRFNLTAFASLSHIYRKIFFTRGD